MSSFEIAWRTGNSDPDRRRTSAMNGRPIRARTSPERVVQIRPPASLRSVRMDSGVTNSLAIVRSVSSWRPSRVRDPRNLRSWAAYIKIVVGTTLLVFTRRGGGLILSGPMRPPMLEPRAVAQVDPGGMRDIIASLPDQIAAATRASATHFAVDEAQRIFLVGMGGSAIAGDVFAAWVSDRSKVPIQVVRDYRLPSYARSEDLLVAVSYSGNTEETLSATAQGIKLGCRLIAITSGGTLADLGRNNDFPVFPVPTGLPPRGAFGHLFGILAAISGEWTFSDPRAELGGAVAHLRDVRGRLRPESGIRVNRAKALAVRIKNTVPIIYAAHPFSPIAKRWQTQLNENSKVLAFSSTF